jgi:hypothetical protein
MIISLNEDFLSMIASARPAVWEEYNQGRLEAVIDV